MRRPRASHVRATATATEQASALWYLVTRPCCLAALRHCSYEGLEHGEEAGHDQVPDWVEEAEQQEVEYGGHNQIWYYYYTMNGKSAEIGTAHSRTLQSRSVLHIFP